MEISDLLAVLALMISVASVFISFKAYRYTVNTNESETRQRFSRDKSEFLVRIDKAQKIFEQLENKLISLIQRVERSPESVRNASY